jgi:DNA-binding XRE family transcriptional regulator
VEVLDRYKRQIGNPLTAAWSTGAMAMLTRSSAPAKIDKDLGAKLRAFRLAAGLTQSELGDFLGISHTQMMKYELGKNRMAVSTLVQLCMVLKLDPMAFLGDQFHRR